MASVIPRTLLQGLVDRVGAQEALFTATYTAATADGGGKFYPRIHQAAAQNGDQFTVENDLISSANALDTTKITEATIAPGIWRDMVSALKTHATNAGYASFDSLLSGMGLNVGNDFATVYRTVIGSALNAINVFTPSELLMGTVDFTSSGVATFTDGSAVGTGSGSVSATNYDAAMIHAIPSRTVGANDVILNVRTTNTQLAAAAANVTILSGSTPGTRVSVGASGTDFYFDVTNVVVAGGNADDQVVLYAQPERTVSL